MCSVRGGVTRDKALPPTTHICIYQALTWYYILQRPELAVVEKQRKKKFPLCGRVYSTMNPRNPVNYFNLSLVLFEFLQERYP